MGVTAPAGRLTRTAVRATRVLTVEVPGWATTRVAVERAVGARGWGPAWSPAAADVLVVCGRLGDAWRPVVDRLWSQLPGPAARIEVADPDRAPLVLDAAARTLLAGGSIPAVPPAHQQDARDDRGRGEGNRNDDAGADDCAGDHGGMDHDGMDHGGMDHGGMDHGNSDHGGMDHGGMEMDMPMPGGIPLAGGADDRDGLEMDSLTVPLGPVLPAWPAGLVLRCTVHGDVIAQARVDTVPAPVPSDDRAHPDGRTRAALECDGVARFLTVAGARAAATGFRRVRDDLLDGASVADCGVAVESLLGRVRRSRLLRWSIRGIGGLDAARLAERGLPAALGGDVHDRLMARMAGLRDRLASGAPAADPLDRGADTRARLDLLPSLVVGLDLGAARLVVASLDPDVAAIGSGVRTHG